MFDPEPRMSFPKNHAAEKSKGVTQLLRVESKELKVHRILSRALLDSQDHVSSSQSQRYRNVRRFLDPTRRLATILTSRGDSPVLTGGIGNSHTGCPSRWT